MEMRYVKAVMKANLYAFICWMKNNRSYAFFMLFWPYMMAFFLFGLGSILGSIEEYKIRMEIANPILYILASSSIMVSSISIIDNVAGELLRHRWIGTLPYVISSPPRFMVYAVAGPIPATMLSSFISLSSILPAALYFEGLIGGIKIFVVLCYIYLAMIPLIGIAVIIGGLSLIAGEEANVAGFLTPFILLVSGVFYPQTILPFILQLIGRCLPLAYVVDATKLLATYTVPPLNALLTIAGFLIGMSIIYNGVSMPGMFFIERRILRVGVYEE